MIKQAFFLIILSIHVQSSTQQEEDITFEYHCTYQDTETSATHRFPPHPMKPTPQIKLYVYADYHLLNKTFNKDLQEMKYYLSDVVEGARKLVEGLGLDLYWYRLEVGDPWYLPNVNPSKRFEDHVEIFGDVVQRDYKKKLYDIAIHVSGNYLITYAVSH